MKQPGDDDCDEELDEPTAQEIARQYVKEHGTADDEED